MTKLSSTLRLAPALCALALSPIWMGADGCEDKTVGDKHPSCDNGSDCSAPDAGTNDSECTYNGKTYAGGESFAATDGCNTCTCGDAGDVSCTEKACNDGDAGTSGGDCTFEGKSYSLGDSIPRADGCGTCICGKAGEVMCPGLGCPWLSPNWTDFAYDVGSAFGGSNNWLLKPDGTLTETSQAVDDQGMPKPPTTKDTKLSEADLSVVTQALDSAELRNALKNGFDCPPPPEDVGVFVTMHVEGQQLYQDVTGCINDMPGTSTTPARDNLAKVISILTK